jgi:hypothetical protein
VKKRCLEQVGVCGGVNRQLGRRSYKSYKKLHITKVTSYELQKVTKLQLKKVTKSYKMLRITKGYKSYKLR